VSGDDVILTILQDVDAALVQTMVGVEEDCTEQAPGLLPREARGSETLPTHHLTGRSGSHTLPLVPEPLAGTAGT